MGPAADSNAVPPPGAVAVTVSVAAAAGAPAAPAAAPAAPARRAATPAAPAAAPAAPARRAAAPAVLVATLFVLGCAAAALALFAMTLAPADSRVLVRSLVARHQTAPSLAQGSCARTDTEAADLRAASELLLLAASAQVLAAAAALLVRAAQPVAFFAYAVGCLTAYRAKNVVWMLVACHGRVHGALAFHFWFFYAVLLAALLVGCFHATCSDD